MAVEAALLLFGIMIVQDLKFCSLILKEVITTAYLVYRFLARTAVKFFIRFHLPQWYIQQTVVFYWLDSLSLPFYTYWLGNRGEQL